MNLRILAFFLCALTGFLTGLPAQKKAVVYHLSPHQIDQMENLPYAVFIERSLQKAKRDHAALVILEINTPGGELAATLKIKNVLLSSPVPVICFINKNAISAGSLVALSCSKIVMAPGGVIGAATPVFIKGDEMKKAPEKVVSATRASWRAAAEAHGKPPRIAEAFVDENIVLTKKKDGISKPKGQLLTLTSEEALKLGIADYIASDIYEILKREKLEQAQVVLEEPDFYDSLLAFFLHPAISGILIGLGFLGLLVEIRVPGWGIPGTLGILFLTLYFVSKIMIGESGWGAPALFAFSLLLLLLEIFVIPGFGIAGILGLSGLLVSILWSYGISDVSEGLWVLSIAMIGTLALFFVFLKYLPKLSGHKNRIFLTQSLPSERNPRKHFPAQGTEAVAFSDLRPSGIIQVGDKKFDAVSDGEYIEAGSSVIVEGLEGAQAKVRRKV